MTKHNISQAARAVGVSRKTMQRHIQKGKVSCEVDAGGVKWIDASELIRAYGNIKEAVPLDALGQDEPMSHRDAPIDTALLKQENEFLTKENQRLEGDIRERKEREERLEAEKTELRGIIDKQATSLLPKPEDQSPSEQKPKALTWLNAILIGCGIVGTGFGVIMVLMTWVLPHLG